MSNQQSYYQSSSFSYSSSSNNGQTRSYSEATHTDPTGTKVHRSKQEPGQAPVEERFQYDNSGRRVEDGGNRARIEGNRVEDVTDQEDRAAREYEERMEEEYAKREGGA